MKIVAISDTHTMHRSLTKKMPEADVLIHAGDITGRGELHHLQDFCAWLDELPYQHKIIIAGNHDWCFVDFDRRDLAFEVLGESAIYLEDSSVTLRGIKFYGSPYTPAFMNWAFNLPRGKPLKDRWDLIPEDTDVLITHGPPSGVLDFCGEGRGGHVGDEDLRDRVNSLQGLGYHVFGHIHEGYGQLTKGGLTSINASTCTGGYYPTNDPIVFEV